MLLREFFIDENIEEGQTWARSGKKVVRNLKRTKARLGARMARKARKTKRINPASRRVQAMNKATRRR